MAHWTFYIALLTGAGVLLLIGTLAETANATKAAVTTANITREIGEAQARGYVTIKPLSFTLRKGFRDGTSFRLRFKLTVSGQTPVYDTRSKTTVMVPTNGGDPQQPENPRFHDAWRTHNVIRPGESAVIVSATGSTDQTLRQRLRAAYPNIAFENPTFGFNVLVEWVDAFNIRLRQNYVVYANTQSADDHSTLAIDVAAISPIEIVERKRFPAVEQETKSSA